MTRFAASRRAGFTLIEISIVVTIMAVLAAAVLPHFTGSTDDAKDCVVRHNLQVLRLQIDLYKLNHKGGAPDGSANLAQLVSATDVDGNLGVPGGEFRLGPYLADLPANPYTGSAKVRLFAGPGLPTPSNTPDAGWIYQPSTGAIWCDDPVVISRY
jgi:prepilin-type N-terminal cleavage/methylation domain-containing protein